MKKNTARPLGQAPKGPGKLKFSLGNIYFSKMKYLPVVSIHDTLVSRSTTARPMGQAPKGPGKLKFSLGNVFSIIAIIPFGKNRCVNILIIDHFSIY
jgi:hypothetical protein